MTRSAELSSIDEILEIGDHAADHGIALEKTKIACPRDLKYIKTLDPFSDEYRAEMIAIYEAIKGRQGYDVAEDEKSTHNGESYNNIPPYSEKNSVNLSDFLISWAQISRLLDVKGNEKILEYGPGSGQLLLMLARSGFDVYGVDIDDGHLTTIRQQANALGVKVQLEKGLFGEGFDEKKFDRIIFFEAFHHSLDFFKLLAKLRSRLTDSGFVVFCGEPIVSILCDELPYPWGPRLDGLAVFATRKFGWMELGFTHNFFINALRQAGFKAKFKYSPNGRAIAYVAHPCEPEPNLYSYRNEMIKRDTVELFERGVKFLMPKFIIKEASKFLLTCSRVFSAFGNWLWSQA
jgi:SAM-dependent methyltransferase